MNSDHNDVDVAQRMRAAVQQHDGVLRNFLRRALGSKEDAEDVLQEVYVRLLQREKQDAIADYPRSYLFVTATNIIRDRRRRERIKEKVYRDPLMRDFEQLDPVDPQPSAETMLMSREGVEIVKSALKDIKPVYAEIFSLHWGDGLTFAEISRRTGIPNRSVERYAGHALAHCRRALEKKNW